MLAIENAVCSTCSSSKEAFKITLLHQSLWEKTVCSIFKRYYAILNVLKLIYFNQVTTRRFKQNMLYIAFIHHLQGHTKLFVYSIVYEEYFLKKHFQLWYAIKIKNKIHIDWFYKFYRSDIRLNKRIHVHLRLFQ